MKCNHKKVTMRGMIFILFLGMAFFSCSKDAPEEEYTIQIPEDFVSKGDRIFNIAPSEGGVGFTNTFQEMQKVGCELVELNLDWDYFEKEQGQYQDPNGLLQAVGFYGQNGLELGLSLATINTVKRTNPEYLDQFNYDDPEYVQAFEELLDWIFDNISPDVKIHYISVGNEIDIYFQEEDWSPFENFLLAAKDYIKEKDESILVGAKLTITAGLVGRWKTNALRIIDASDIAMLNYYPQDHQARVYGVDEALDILAEAIAPISKNIYFTELGMQSGTKYCDSSEEHQANFFYEYFQFWDNHIDQIKFTQLVWMHDVTSSQLEDFEEYYGLSDPGFLEYLSTLGVKNTDGTSKLAWEQIKSDAQLRGWK